MAALVITACSLLAACASARVERTPSPIVLDLIPAHTRCYADDPTPLYLVIRNASNRPVTIVDPVHDSGALSLSLTKSDGSPAAESEVDLGLPMFWELLPLASERSTDDAGNSLHWDGPLVELPPGFEWKCHLGDFEVEVASEGFIADPLYSKFHRAGDYEVRARLIATNDMLSHVVASGKNRPVHPEKMEDVDVLSNVCTVHVYPPSEETPR
ncbi:MAG: hypothetical protein HYR85_26225 [Planctomycetes bacterium]|nr:hypothetical protein [Planctomycetota bacterium]MBI3848230.1 hypothetical protein [Planctomycetota bacterium]